MSERDQTGRTVVLVGGAALAAWLLSRGKGWAFRSPGDGSGANAGETRQPAHCTVWIRANRIEVDGVAADLPTVIAKCRAVGAAEVRATGDAITGVVRDVLTALHAAGVKLQLPPDLAYIAPSESMEPARRNGTLSAYRPIGERGGPYPAWLRNLRVESGVYVIREIGGPIVYVGSSVRRLYDTLTRHFQRWRRYKGFWRGQFAEGADPGLTYDRSSVEVAIKLTTPDEAHEEELRMIRRLQPRDNQLGQPGLEPDLELEDAPF